MKKLTNLLYLLTVASALFACSAGTNNPEQIQQGIYNLTFTPGAYNSTGSTTCTGGSTESQIMVVESNGTAMSSVYANNGTQLLPFYSGTFSNTINQNPCFTGKVLLPAGCSAINTNSTIQFTGCSYTSMGTYYQVNAIYQIYTLDNDTGKNLFIMQGTVSGTGN